MTAAPSLEELEAFLAKATPGPWDDDGSCVRIAGSRATAGCPAMPGCIASLYDGEYIENHNAQNDAALIVAAVNALPTLLTRLRNIERERDAAVARVGELEDGLQAHRSVELRDLMRELSEDYWCAGWLVGLEHSLWRMVFDDAPRRFGMGEIPAEQIERLRFLATETNTWWRWGEDGEEAVTLADFRHLLRKDAQ